MAFLLFHRSLLGFSSRLHSAPSSSFFPLILSLSLTLSFFSLTLFQLVRAPLPLLLFPLLICFPLPVGNCALSLLPSRRYSLVCTCRCSPLYGSAFFAHLLFLLLQRASLPPRFTLPSDGHAVPSLRPDFSPLGPPPPSSRPRQATRRQSGLPASSSPRARLRNLIIRRLIICGRDKNYIGTIIFSRESLRAPLSTT